MLFRPIDLSPEQRIKYAARFWEGVLILNPDECWPWQRARDRNGYGICWAGRNLRASRLSYYLTHNADPGECAMHTCDNPPCVNPAHLVGGTHAENNRDMRRKGRARSSEEQSLIVRTYCRRGSAHPDAKLTEADIPTIRLLASQGHTQRAIAELYGVDHMGICKIINGKAWTHV